MEIKDKIHNKRIEIKKIKKKRELHHAENIKICDLDQTIKIFIEKCKKENANTV